MLTAPQSLCAGAQAFSGVLSASTGTWQGDPVALLIESRIDWNAIDLVVGCHLLIFRGRNRPLKLAGPCSFRDLHKKINTY